MWACFIWNVLIRALHVGLWYRNMQPTECILPQPYLKVSPHLCSACQGKACLLPLWPEPVENTVMRRHWGHQVAERLRKVALEALLSMKQSMSMEGKFSLGSPWWDELHLPLPVWKHRWCHDGTERARSHQESAMRDLMEKVSRCQLHFPRGFLGASTVINFVSPLHKSCGMMPKTNRAPRWHKEGQAAKSTSSLGLRVASNFFTLQTQSIRFAVDW